MNALIPPVNISLGRSGPWVVEKFTADPNSIGAFRLAMDGRSVHPGEYTRLMHDHRGIVMSDTPAERRDHFGFIRNATGHVLINGLGIGMCLNAALKKPEVTRATVVEIDMDVINLVASNYASDPRVEIVCSSAFDYQPPKGVRYGAVWHDIWDAICADNLPEMHRLHRKYARRAEWQGSWARQQCERQRQRWSFR